MTMRNHHACDCSQVNLFLNEARALAAFSNNHMVPIFQIGQDGNNHYLVIPLLAGETLQNKLERDGILPLNEFLRIARELTLGLMAIHAKGPANRDLIHLIRMSDFDRQPSTF